MLARRSEGEGPTREIDSLSEGFSMRGFDRAAVLFFLPLALPIIAAAEDFARATPAARTRQELVVTNQNLATVVESRRVNLPSGSLELFWEAVSPSVRTETWTILNAQEAGVRWLGLTAPLTGEAAGQRWLSSLIGKTVTITRPGGTKAEGEVLAVHGATPDLVLFREGSELVYGEPEARLSVPAETSGEKRPAGLSLKLDSERAGEREIVSRYLVSNLTWEANYALTLAPEERSGRLEGWFTVDNRTGAEFTPSRLRLLAGTLRTVGQPIAIAGRADMSMMQASVAQSLPLSESRIYEVPSPSPLPAGRSTFPLAENVTVQLEKRYIVRSNYWVGQNDESQRLPVAVQYRVETKPLESALPAGVIRVYADGGTVFAGEDSIEHTAEKNDLEIETSEAFDLTARRRQVSFTQTSRFETESSYEVTVASRKKEPVTVLVRESLPGDWNIVESSLPPKKKSASEVEFGLPVPAGGEAKLTYRVRVRTGR